MKVRVRVSLQVEGVVAALGRTASATVRTRLGAAAQVVLGQSSSDGSRGNRHWLNRRPCPEREAAGQARPTHVTTLLGNSVKLL